MIDFIELNKQGNIPKLKQKQESVTQENKSKKETAKDYIEEAFFLLLKQKSFTSLRIQEITKKAGVSRVTFYRNFQSKKDIVLHYFQKKKDEFTSRYNEHTMEMTSESIMRYIFLSFKNEKERLQLLDKNNLLYLYLDFLDQELSLGHNNIQTDYPYRSRFFSGALYNVSLYWLRHDCKESIDDLVLEIMKASKALANN